MRRSITFAAVALLAIMGFYVLARAQDAHGGAAKAERAWEYKVLVMIDVVTVDDVLDTDKARVAAESKFNELGRDGWEYCGDITGGVVFKRPRP